MILNERLFEDSDMTYATESINRRPRRALKESLPRGEKGRFFSDMYNAVSDVILKYEAYSWEEDDTRDVAPSKEDIESALDMVKRKLFELDYYYKESFTNKPRKQRRTVNESLRKNGKKLNETLLDAVLDRIDGEPYNPREFYDYVNGWYNDVAHEMDEGEEEDVANAIIRGLKDSIGYIGSNPDNDNAQQLYKFVKDSTWLTNGKTGETPDYLRQLQNTVDESLYEDFDSDSARSKCKEFYRELKWDLPEGNNADLPNNVVKAFEKAGGRCRISRKTPNGFKYDGDVKGFTISGNIFLNSLQSDLNRLAEDLTMAYYVYLGGERQYIPDFIRSLMNESMNEDLEPEAVDEPEKAEITWVDDSGEQKVSTVELINKSFPETALKFSKEHGDCSIINCTAPLKGAQKEDEPETVALTESEETDGLANLISNEINGEFETTNGYRNLRQVASEVAPDMLPVIDDIMDEENTHVGQLQTLLSMVDDSAENIDVGAEEAEDQLEDEDVEIEHNDEVDVDFADIKKSDKEDADLEVKDDFDFDDEPFDEE